MLLYHINNNNSAAAESVKSGDIKIKEKNYVKMALLLASVIFFTEFCSVNSKMRTL